MREFIIYFSLFFLLFGSVGYYFGSEDVNDKDFLRKHTFNKASIVKLSDTYYLGFKKGDSVTYMFNVDTDTLVRVDAQAVLDLNNTTIPDKNILNYLKQGSPAAIGSGVIGFTIRDLLASSLSISRIIETPAGRGSVLGIILGSICGYNCGYWLAAHTSIPADNSDAVASILVADSNWKFAKREIFLNMCTRAKILIQLINDARRKKLYDDILTRGINRTWTSKRIQSADLMFLFTIDSSLQRVIKKDYKNILDPDKHSTWKDFSTPLLTVAIVAVLIVLAFFVNRFYLQYRKRKSKFPNTLIPANLDDILLVLNARIEDKQKARIKEMSEQFFFDKEVHKLGTSLYKEWNLGWDSYTEKRKKQISKPALLGYFQSFGITSEGKMKRIILISFYRNLQGQPTDFASQLQEPDI